MRSSAPDVAWLPASPLEGWASMDRYWRELDNLVHESQPMNLHIQCVLPAKPPVRSATASRIRRMLDKYVVYPGRAKFSQARLFHVLDHSYAHLLPCLPRSSRKIVTVFDLVPFEDPGSMSGAQVARFKRTVQNLHLADHLISISEETRRKLGTYLNIPEERITVAVPGTDFALFQKPVSGSNSVHQKLSGLPKAILSVGSAISRKNLRSLPAIFNHLRPQFERGQCCFVRAGETLPETLRREITAITGEKGFVELGPLFGEDLIAAFQSSRVLIFPSTLEGLTFVIPEAMAAGCPVVTNTLTANPEAGGEFALYYTESDANAAARHLLTLLADDTEHARRRALGIERARGLTWKHHFEILLDVYRRQLSRS